MVFLFAIFFFGISESFSIQVINSFDIWGFDDSKKISFLFTKRVAGAFDVQQFNLTDSKLCISCSIWSFSLRFSSLESVNPSLSNWYILLISGVLSIAKKYRFYLRNVWREHLICRSAVQSFIFKVVYLLFYLVFLFAVFFFGISESFSIQLIYYFDF